MRNDLFKRKLFRIVWKLFVADKWIDLHFDTTLCWYHSRRIYISIYYTSLFFGQRFASVRSYRRYLNEHSKPQHAVIRCSVYHNLNLAKEALDLVLSSFAYKAVCTHWKNLQNIFQLQNNTPPLVFCLSQAFHRFSALLCHNYA